MVIRIAKRTPGCFCRGTVALKQQARKKPVGGDFERHPGGTGDRVEILTSDFAGNVVSAGGVAVEEVQVEPEVGVGAWSPARADLGRRPRGQSDADVIRKLVKGDRSEISPAPQVEDGGT